MLLRSSSSPVIGTLLPPFSDSPSRDFDTKIFFIHGSHQINNLNYPSQISHIVSGFSDLNRETNCFRLNGFRRSWSDGNLEGLAFASSDIEEFRNSYTPRKFLYKHNKSMLITAPSFEIYNSGDGSQNEEDSIQEALERSAKIGNNIEASGSGEFSFGKKGMGLIEEEEGEEEEEGLNVIQNLSIGEEGEPASPPMYLASGLGIDGGGFGGDDWGGGGDFAPPSSDETGNVEEYYKRMLDGYPNNPLFLRNYAQLLQSKGHLHGAEEYYFRATLADPKDGEILLQYAKLVWELHHDQDRALSYFQHAAQAAPQDSHILAAYASFLWELENDGEEDGAPQDHVQVVEEKGLNEFYDSASREEIELVSSSEHLPAGHRIDETGFTAAESCKDGNYDEYYRRMVEENPCNPLFLRNYAQFLYQSKGDLQGAEEYYWRAIQADPRDGEIMSQYAKLVWEIHHDQDKALYYFELAVQTTPENSHVLAAYASFLWETDEGEEDRAMQDDIQASILYEGAITTANAQL